jgi:hypothetical protein
MKGLIVTFTDILDLSLVTNYIYIYIYSSFIEDVHGEKKEQQNKFTRRDKEIISKLVLHAGVYLR